MGTTGPDFHEEHRLADGTRVELRHIRPDDAAELRRGFARLSPESRYRRFLTPMTELGDELLRYLTCVDGHDHVAIVAVTPEGVGLGVARFIRTRADPTVAEPAIAVVDDMQRKGVGHLLAVALARAARERGVERFRGEMLADNPGIRELLDEAGAEVRRLPDGSTVFDVSLAELERRGLERSARRLLRAAASYFVGVLRRLTASPCPPPA